MNIQAPFTFASVHLLGVWRSFGLRLRGLRQFQALLASSARPACASSFCFRSILGLAALWLTGQSSRPAFGGRLTLFVRCIWNRLYGFEPFGKALGYLDIHC